MCHHLLVRLTLLMLLMPFSHGAEHLWIFSGQSNMKASMGAGQKEVAKVVKAAGHTFSSIGMAWNGRPISDWIGTGPDNRGIRWTESLLPAIKAAQQRGVVFAGVCWHQGESDSGRAGAYGKDLQELIAMFRDATGVPDLPFIIAQLNCGTYGYQNGDLSVGMLREAQRRVAVHDPRVVTFGTTDCRVADHVVHLGGGDDSAGLVGKRYARAAAHLAYGAPYDLGPQLKAVQFANEERTVIKLTMHHITGQLTLDEAALQGFAVTSKTRLDPNGVGMPSPASLPAIIGDLFHPTVARIDGDRILLGFPQALPEQVGLSWAGLRNAAYGPVRRRQLEFGRLSDAGGMQAASFVAVPVAPFSGRAVALTAPPRTGPKPASPRIFSLNGFQGKAWLQPEQQAGISAWRLRHWNTGSRFLSPHLKDQNGAISDIAWSGYQHRQPRIQAGLTDADDMLRASLCGPNGTFTKLPSNSQVDLVIYVMMHMVPHDAPANYVTVDVGHQTSPKIAKNGKRGKAPFHQAASKPLRRAAPDAATDHGWIIANESNDHHGNVLIFTDVPTGPEGMVHYRINKQRQPKVDANNRRIDVACYAVQLQLGD